MKFLLIIIIVYFALVLAARYVLPFLLRRFVKKASKRFEQQMNMNNNAYRQKPEGEITINEATGKSHKTGDIGEYTDFEDINEPKKQ